MKIALCLRGISYGSHPSKSVGVKKGHSFDVDESYYFFRETLLTKYDVDVFVHTWNPENESKILEYYQPKKIMIEPVTKQVQKTVLQNCPYKDVKGVSLEYGKYSNYFSMKRCHGLLKDYIEETGVNYDLIIHSRFDVEFNLKCDLESLDSGKFYLFFKETRKFKKGKHSVFDYVFISGMDLMNRFSRVWDDLPEIYRQLKTVKKVRNYRDRNNHVLLGHYLYNMCPEIRKNIEFLEPAKLFCQKLVTSRTLDELERIKPLELKKN